MNEVMGKKIFDVVEGRRRILDISPTVSAAHHASSHITGQSLVVDGGCGVW